MKKALKLFALLFAFGQMFSLSAEPVTAKYQEEDCTINVIYNDKLIPGDAIFVRMHIQVPKSHKKNYNLKDDISTAELKLFQKQKCIASSAFYNTNKIKKANATELLCGVPASLWLANNSYSLKAYIKIGDNDLKEINLPITFQTKEFNSETIQLNAKNTATITDNSPERAAQIEKLNKILYTSDPESVFSLKPFTPPTDSKRYTSFFGDRRVYAYSNGKSSTSVHYGNDYGVKTGTEVHACADGKVVLSEWRNSTGYTIVIEHLPGLYSLYYHNSQLVANVGDIVKAGDLVALSGATGLATGPHVHWEIRLKANAIRPEFFTENYTFEDIEYYK